MKTTMNEYRILYRSDKFKGLHTVSVFAKNDYEAEEKIVNTLAIQKDWIERITTWRLNVDVFVEGGNVNEIYEHWANQRTEEEYIKAWTK
tara:strand:- start:194 stop:463 length:270 start_codon:yes stop_codon:yes gene_type:complete